MSKFNGIQICRFLALVGLIVLPACITAGDQTLPANYLASDPASEEVARLRQALDTAESNGSELIRVIAEAPADQRSAAIWLINNMPPRDLRELPAEFLLTTLAEAYAAREAVPWGASLPDSLFLNYVLPYATINERRDDWRGDFSQRFLPEVSQCRTPGEAAVRLNEMLWDMIDVHYSTKRPKADQSPYESMAAKMASCTGLSVLLVDACRAVSVPARFVGIPQWPHTPGNHSWVEVWDQDAWHFTGASEPAPLGEAWFTAAAAEADPMVPEFSIYAASFERTGTRFICPWDPSVDYVSAINVTPRYLQSLPAGTLRYCCVRVWDQRDGQRVAVDVSLFTDSTLLGSALTRDETSDLNDMAAFAVSEAGEYLLTVTPAEREALQLPVQVGTRRRTVIDIYLSDF